LLGIIGFSLVHRAQKRVERNHEKHEKREADMILKLFVALGAIWAMGFFLFHFIRLLMGRRTF